MPLAVLSTKVEHSEETFKNVLLASVKAHLRLHLKENTYKVNEFTDFYDINIQADYFNEEEWFLMDIHSEKWVIQNNQNDLINHRFKEQKFYTIASTDNAPSHLVYDFSLAYLRLQPQHRISLFDKCIFALEDIEEIEKQGGYFEGWSKKFLLKGI